MAKLIRLNNGIKLFYKKHPSSKALALGVFVGAGSVYEDAKNNGIAHFIEHMVFKGTENRSAYDIANETERRGIMINAFTSRQHTAFYTIGLAEYAEECADILSDIFFRATFDEENLEKEKVVVLEEINMYEDDGEDVCLENLIRAHYGNKMIAAPILGTKKNVKSFNYETIKEFMAKFYRPENTCVSLVGNVSEEYAVNLITKYFVCDKFYPSLSLPRVRTAAPQAKFIKKIKPVEQSCVGIAFPAYPNKHKLHYVPSIVASVLGGGMSSRLFQEVREKSGLVYEIYAVPNQYDTNGYFVVYFATAPNRVCTAVEKVRACLMDAIKTGISEEEFQKALASLKTGLALGSESASEIMRLGGKYGLAGKTVTHDTLIKDLSRITIEDVNLGLKEMLDFKKASLSYVGQEIDCDLYKLFTEGRNE